MEKFRFKNFTPKDDDLRPFWQEGVSVIDMCRKIERELNEKIASAKPIVVQKYPPRPTWDLKRDFSQRNRRLEYQTIQAVAKLNGTGDADMEPVSDDVSPRYMSDHDRETHKLSFVAEDISDDEDYGGFAGDAAKTLGSLQKEDAHRIDEDD